MSWALALIVQSPPNLEPILASARNPSFKVRIQALRVLGRNMPEQEAFPRALQTVRDLARTDPVPLVRAVALSVLGAHGGAADVARLRSFADDPEPLVVKAASDALEQLQVRLGPGVRSVVFEVDPLVVADGTDVTRTLALALARAVNARAGFRAQPVSWRDGAGVWIRVTPQPLEIAASGEGTTVVLELKVSVGRWPERNLRHVLTTRARVTVAGTFDQARIARTLLRAGAEQAVTKALEEGN